jgi:hypothetical protein
MFRRIEFIGSPRVASGKGIVVDALADGLAVVCYFPSEVLNSAAASVASTCPKELFESKKSMLLQSAERKLRTSQFNSGKALISTSDI